MSENIERECLGSDYGVEKHNVKVEGYIAEHNMTPREAEIEVAMDEQYMETETPEERFERILQMQQDEWEERWQEVRHAQKVLEAKMVVSQLANKRFLQIDIQEGSNKAHILVDVARVYENDGNVVINYKFMYRHKIIVTNGRMYTSMDVVQASGEKYREKNPLLADAVNSAYNVFLFIGTKFTVKELTEAEFTESLSTVEGYTQNIQTIHATQTGKTLTV